MNTVSSPILHRPVSLQRFQRHPPNCAQRPQRLIAPRAPAALTLARLGVEFMSRTQR